jgi:preprotein translocase subunit SecD
MKTLAEVLREADPALETRSPQSRALTRMRVLSAHTRPQATHAVSRRRVLALAGTLGIAGIATAMFASRHASVDAIAAVRFEARLAESGETILGNKDILSAKMVPGSAPSTFGIELTFTPEGAEKMRRVTQEHVGEHLQLLIDGEVVIAPLIRAAISDSAVLTGNYTNSEAQRIIEGLLKGKLELRPEK